MSISILDGAVFPLVDTRNGAFWWVVNSRGSSIPKEQGSPLVKELAS